ncbi:MAG: glycoside hydrolase family 27 protein, partial [Lachnospiraceae bacterium]|nr:glycoside hydrolase family 27 protein [Lachnospiraceae bacterium]
RRAEHQYIPFAEVEMDTYSRLLPDVDRFPSAADGKGFGPLADYVHSLGLKFGIHIMRGIPRIAAHHHNAVWNCELPASEVAIASSVCPWNPDMYGVKDTPAGQAYYDSLAQLYACWGVDFIKCDDICRYDQPSAKAEIRMLAQAIEKCGRDMVLSLSPGPAIIDQAWYYEKYANMWRITDDFWDDWRLLKDMFKRCEIWQEHVSAGNYPDCDMLPLGYLGKGFGNERQTRFTPEEQQTMMTLWCLFGSPLMLGAEMTKLDEATLALLTNRKVLQMLNPMTRPHQLCRDECKAIWEAVNEETNEHYVALFHLGEGQEQYITVSLEELGVKASTVKAENLWSGEKVEMTGDVWATVRPHACVVYRIS